MQKIGTCLSDIEINDYLGTDLSNEKREEMEGHLKDCGACLEKMIFAYKTIEEFNTIKTKGVDKMRIIWRNLWLLGALVAFILSFFMPRYFAQFLVATILMGAKWIFDSMNARILIMIYDAWKRGGEKEASKILNALDNRGRP